eukprot:8708904-Lingulodinium_polyedra.AAC.1
MPAPCGARQTPMPPPAFCKRSLGTRTMPGNLFVAAQSVANRGRNCDVNATGMSFNAAFAAAAGPD